MTVRIESALIFFIGLFIFCAGLSGQEIIGFESRFYLFILEMWRHGPSWFPMTYQEPYPDYPVTGIWLMYLCSRVFNVLNKLTVVLPSALVAALTLSVTYKLGALYSRWWGWSAVLFLLFTMTFITEARTISLDLYITLIAATCFYLILSAELFKKPRRYFWIFPLFVCGFAFRGPIGLIIPAGVSTVFYLLEKNYQRFWFTGLIAGLLLILCTGIILSLAYHVGGHVFLMNVLQKEILGRMQDVATPAYSFYFTESLGAYAIIFPLAVLVSLGIFRVPRREKKFLYHLLGWAGIIFLGLSIPADKKIRYILPAAPPLALICGYLWMTTREQIFLYGLKRVFIYFCLIFPALCLSFILLFHYYHPEWVPSFYWFSAGLLFLQIFQFFLWQRERMNFLVAVLVFMLLTYFVIEPINISLNRTHDFVMQVEKLRHQQQAQLVFYREGKDGLVIKYLINMPQEEPVIFINNLEELFNIKSPVVVVATQENFQMLTKKEPVHAAFSGKIGHEPVVVFMPPNNDSIRDD